MSNEPTRAFIALPCPPPLCDEVGEAMAVWRRAAAGVRWTRPQALHLTLRFLGSSDSRRLTAIDSRLGEIALDVAPMPFRLAGTGVFPDWRQPRVLWIACRDAASIEALAARVEAAAREAGFEPEPRPFVPHVTVGRSARHRRVRGVEPFRGWTSKLETAAVREMVLFRSDLGPNGARHTPLGRYVFRRSE